MSIHDIRINDHAGTELLTITHTDPEAYIGAVPGLVTISIQPAKGDDIAAQVDVPLRSLRLLIDALDEDHTP